MEVPDVFDSKADLDADPPPPLAKTKPPSLREDEEDDSGSASDSSDSILSASDVSERSPTVLAQLGLHLHPRLQETPERLLTRPPKHNRKRKRLQEKTSTDPNPNSTPTTRN
jgi:hypothetical protein